MAFKDFLLRCACGSITAGLLMTVSALAAGGDNMLAGHTPGQHMQNRFDQMDTDKDGKVVLEEFRAAYPNMNEQAFGVIDVNGNKAIERAEWFDFMEGHAKGKIPGMGRTSRLNNIPGDPLIPPPDSSDLPLMRPSE